MTLRFKITSLVILILSSLTLRCSHNQPDKDPIYRQFTHLSTSYQDSLRDQEGGLRASFLKKWGNRFWKIAKENPNHRIASQSALNAFEIYEDFGNPNIYLEKLNALSIHDRAMSGVLSYWNRALDDGYVPKLRQIAKNTRSSYVQIAAHYHLAKWYTIFKYYGKAQKQLYVLRSDHKVDRSHPKYGKTIATLQAEIDRISAGKTVPEFNMKLLNGENFTNRDLRNKITFLYFYGKGCGQCISMYPKITALYNKYRSEGFNVVGIADNWYISHGFDTPEEFETYAKQYNITWPQAYKYAVWDSMNIRLLSTGYLLDQSGNIIRISRSDTVTHAVKGFKKTSLEEAVEKLVNTI